MASKYKIGDMIEVDFRGNKSIGTVVQIYQPYEEYSYQVRWEKPMPWESFDEGSQVGRATKLITLKAEELTPETYDID